MVFAIIGDLNEIVADAGVTEADVLSLLNQVVGRHGASLHIDRQPGHLAAIEVTAPGREAIVDIGSDLHYEFGGHDSFNEQDFLDAIGEIEEL